MAVQVNLDGLRHDSWAASQLHSQGIIFATPAIFMHDEKTGTNAVYPTFTESDNRVTGSPNRVILRAHFCDGRRRSRLALAIANGANRDKDVRATLRVLSVDGVHVLVERHVLSSKSAAVADVAVPFPGPFEVDRPAGGFELVGDFGDFTAVTAIEWDLLPTPDFRIWATVGESAIRAGTDDVLTATLLVERWYGSRGKILLAVQRAPPGLVWGFSPPAPDTDEKHVDLQIRTTRDADCIGSHSVEVMAIPASDEAGSSKALVLIPVTVVKEQGSEES